MSSTFKVSNGDLYIDPVTGAPKLISGLEKVSQDIFQILLTDLDQSATPRSGAAFRRNYGSELTLVQKPFEFSGLIGKPLVARKIQEAINRLMILQERDPFLTSEEKISQVLDVFVETLGPTDYAFLAQVLVEAGDITEVTNLEPVAGDHQFPPTAGVDDR